MSAAPFEREPLDGPVYAPDATGVPQGPWPTLSPSEYDDIHAEVWATPWMDPMRFQECLEMAMAGLSEIALKLEDQASVSIATDVLRRIVRRAHLGGPLEQDYNPLDWGPRRDRWRGEH